MGIKNIFALKKATRYSFPFVQPSLDAGNSLKWLLGIFQDGGPLTHSQVLSTFQDGGRVKFPTLGTVVDVKIPTHVRFTKSNSRGLPGPRILGQTIDRCITLCILENYWENLCLLDEPHKFKMILCDLWK